MTTDIFITSDNVQYLLNSAKMKSRVILAEEGTGMPEIEYITSRGPFQHGETLRDFFLRPRIIQMRVRGGFCTLQRYWSGRANILDMFRPNRSGGYEGTLRKVLPDGSKRDIKVVISEGPKFVAKGEGWDEWAYDEVIRFIAHNPVYFDPTQQTVTFTTPVVATFPMTFPIVFGSLYDTESVVYAGNWEEYPTITVNGPIMTPIIENTTTGEKLQLNTSLTVGQYVTYNLTASTKPILRNDGADMYQYLSNDSDLVSFHLAPNATNTIIASGNGTTNATSIVMTYYNRYIGI